MKILSHESGHEVSKVNLNSNFFYRILQPPRGQRGRRRSTGNSGILLRGSVGDGGGIKCCKCSSYSALGSIKFRP